MTAWRIAVDRGGTFTDVLAVRGATVRQAKVLSHGQCAIVRGLRAVLSLDPNEPLPIDEIAEVRLGTTLATNALLTRTGAKTVLVTTQGFRDLPLIGDQRRPDLFALQIKRPDLVAAMVIEADERLGHDGQIVRSLDQDRLHKDLQEAKAAGCTAVAIALLHGWKHDIHERAAAAVAHAVGFDEVVTSRVSPVQGLIRRTDTCSLDAALTPVLQGALTRTREELGDVPIQCMQSSGGLVGLDEFRGARAVLSGPAGGLLGAASVAHAHQATEIVAFDMGGTSTDVSWCGGVLERETDTVLAGVRVSVPMLRVHTVAAGGGSICQSRGGRLRVGPESAGAKPGPASYGCGGPATLTDCHIVLGRLPVDELPHVFGTQENAPLSLADATAALKHVGDAAGMNQLSCAEGLLDVGVESIAAAIREVTVAQGHDVRRAALVAFGGAGGQVACRVADRLGMETVIMPSRAGVLSAQGIAEAAVAAVRHTSVDVPVADSARLDDCIDAMTCDAAADLGPDVSWTRQVSAGLRAEGWDRSIQVAWSTPSKMRHRFFALSQERFGFQPRGEIVIESIEVEVSSTPDPIDFDVVDKVPHRETTCRMWVDGTWHAVPVIRGDIDVIDGPAILLQEGATTVVEPGWRAEGRDGSICLRRIETVAARDFDIKSPADIEIANRRFLSICREMGIVLQHTAVSVNVKERRDYSCAIFDVEGQLVANGPHMPVHLGSMGQSVRRVLEVHRASMVPGDAFLDNDPAHGGTHLPDLTVVTPLWRDGELQYLVASRAHHADIGGTTPGSMPADSTSLDEEGVVFDAALLMRQGVMLEEKVLQDLSSARFPARRPDVNIEDLRAQIAANARGADLLDEMRQSYGDCLQAAMDVVRANAGACVREVIRSLEPGRARIEMDGGDVVAVSLSPMGDHLVIDFEGTSSQMRSNLNAPQAVVRAAVLYALRCLVADDLPLNDGCLDPVEIRIPKGSVLSPAPGAAVVGGNVETSQIVVDALFEAASVLAGSQGTMNNLTFGNDSLQYYETVCGGAGAGPNFDGASAVHTHMTNSVLTDPEILEGRYPVRLEQFSLRSGSGGVGQWVGGDGAVRSIRFLKPLTVSLLAGRRVVPARGLHGADDGHCGSQWLERAGGQVEMLPGTFRREVKPGDLLVIQTPGGGGYGSRRPEGRRL